MYEIARRHLGKVVAGAAMAVTGTAVAVAISLPGAAGADDTPGGRGAVGAGGISDVAGSAGSSGQQGTAGTQGGDGAQAPGAAPPPATVAPVAAEGEKGVGSDPLTDDELARAESLALTPPGAAAQQNVEGGRGPQHLGADLADPLPGDGTRRAEVRFYDYARDELITRTVNLATGKVEKSGAQRGVQPSAHPEELREAMELILASPLGKGVKEDYKDATGKELTSTVQLWFNGDLYRTYREANVPPQLARCGEHRCVRLVTKVLNGAWIDTRNLIVDLSARTVTRVG
ncbi:Tat pathway signal sequence domain protein [Streptomyces sp. NBC_00572]|uniref:Tat pathway signal sequence domain protein n=1 Tax=Streptomyces sp. NBC_00572 TaxID=2903664 RepID=UPI00224F5CDF|nr:Tat pathway signal sequence domain protein [Streptomyces sp. NBC_00572]MCX4984205.1 Tat pathway signal sequence domain protein [Streptomyces sp. NBC_00572]